MQICDTGKEYKRKNLVLEIVIILFLIIWFILAVRYLRKVKKKGGCVGCPHAAECSKKMNSKQDVTACCDFDVKNR